MKFIIVGLISFYFCSVVAQDQLKEADFGGITVNLSVSENTILTSEVKNLLTQKLKQIATNGGIGGSAVNPRFAFTATPILVSKDIIPGPPQLIAQKVDVILFLGDAENNILFSTTTLALKGIGNNENKSFLDAIQSINPKEAEIKEFIEKGKNLIISFYKEQCDAILNESIILGQQENYGYAIYKLSLVPNECKDCYSKCLDKIGLLYQAKINQEGKVKLNEAIYTWNIQQDIKAARNAFTILSQINVDASCQPEVKDLMVIISKKLDVDAQKEWDFKVKQYNDSIVIRKDMLRNKKDESIIHSEQNKIQLELYKAIAIEYAKSHPITIDYSNIYWK